MSSVERSCNLTLFYVQGARMSYRPDSMQSFTEFYNLAFSVRNASSVSCWEGTRKTSFDKNCPCAAAKLVNRQKCNSFAPFSSVLCLFGATSYAFCCEWDFLWLFFFKKKKFLSVWETLCWNIRIFFFFIYVWCGYLVLRVNTLGFCLLMLINCTEM